MWLESHEPEARERLALLLDWPEVREEREREQAKAAASERDRAQTESAEKFAATFGGKSIDSMYERAVRARTLALAQRQEQERQAAAKRIRDLERDVLKTDAREVADEAAAKVEREEGDE